MKRLVTSVLVAGMLATACSRDDSDGRGDEAADDASSSSACDPAWDEAFTAWADAGFSGSVAITTEDETECMAAYGLADQASDLPNTPDTVFSIGSVTKAFTAAAVLDLADQGALSLDARAGELVPGLAGPAAGVTVRQLLLHTAGLTGSHGQDHVPLDRDAAVTALGELELAFEPGTEFLYSNAGYTLLAVIVEETSGMSYRDYMSSQLLRLPGGDVAGGFWDGEPAAPRPRAVGYMEDGTPGQIGDFAGPHWAMDGNAGLAMTMDDLARWADGLFAGQVVSAGATAALTDLRFEQGDGTAEIPGWVALDPSTLGEAAFAVAGGGGDEGHNVVVAVVPESRRVVTIASNTADVTAEALLEAVGPALVAGDPLPRPETGTGDASDVDPAAVAAIEGTYQLDNGGQFVVGARDGRLAVAAEGTYAVAALFPLPEGTTPDDVAAHETAVEALLRGETGPGREEREALESDLGPIDAVSLAGTVVRDGELRTYVTLTAGGEAVLAWYALDDAGGVGAVELGTEPPTLLLVASGDGYAPDDPTGAGPDLAVGFPGGDDEMTVEVPGGGTVTARRVG